MVVLRMGALKIAVALLLLLLTSCWIPLLNVDVSLAQLTKSKLSKDVSFTTSTGYGSDIESLQAIAERTRYPAYVAIIAKGRSNYQVMTYSAASGWNSSSQQGGTFNPAVNDVNRIVAAFGSPHVTGYTMAVFTPTMSDGVMNFFSAGASSIYPTTPSAGFTTLGMSSRPSGSTGTVVDMIYKQSPNLSVSQFASSNTSVFNFNNGPESTSFSSSLYSHLDDLESGWATYDEGSGIIYLTGYSKDSQGRYTTRKIDSTGETETWTRTDRVEAYLTTGQLLTRDGGFYNVCNASGTILSSFPAGSLLFAGEYLEASGEARTMFTEALYVKGENGGGTQVGVYSIPTKDIGSLR